MAVSALEFAIAISFASACIFAFGAAAIVAMGAAMRARALSNRAKRIIPPGMIAHARIASTDAERAAAALQALAPLAQRASLATASIALSLEYYRAQIARVRGSAS